MSAFIGEIEFWGLLILLPIGAALVGVLAMNWTSKRMAGLVDRATPQHKDDKPQN